ncbi:uncharacterized protein LOC112099054 [Citrus clementina]|uniref:uncharacterized protein LOC112099054 n=1 Tax=Citrus clementina TaxID=85681 RepID=UPI000CED0C57|nr:uncharacterized protein LOC112099054 [Citrus x clementina]
MSKGKEKVIEVDDDELDFLPSLLADPAFDLGIPLEPIRPSIGTSARRMSPEATTSNSNDDGSSDSVDTLSEDPREDSGEASSLEVSQPERKRNLGGKALAENYAVDLMTCMTIIEDLIDLRTIYDIPDGIPLRVPGKKDNHSRPPKGYVTLFLERFKFWMRQPLQPYFVQILSGLHLAPGQLNPNGWRVETVLANSYSCRELLSTYNLFESRLIPTNLEMEDVVIGAMNRKRHLPNAAKRHHHKDAPPGKRVNTTEQVAPLKTLPPSPPKAGETSGIASGADPTSSPLAAGLKPCLPDNRPEMVPYFSEFSRLVSKKDFEKFDGNTLDELVGAMQFSAFHLGCMTTYYKAKAKAITLEEELNKVKEDLQTQKATYEAQLESLSASHQTQVEKMEKEADNQYDQGLWLSYRCIMVVLGKQHPNLKMDELAAGVAEYMDEKVAKEDGRELEPNASEETTSPPFTALTDVADAIYSSSLGQADPGMLGFLSHHKTGFETFEPFRALETYWNFGGLLAFT